MRFLLVAASLSIFASLPSAHAGMQAEVKTALDQSGAPSVHINRLTGEVRFVRLRSPTELTLESAVGALALPTHDYPAGVVVDASALPYRLHWRSEQPFEAIFDAGNVLVPQLLGADPLDHSSFEYWPPPLSHHELIGTGGIAVFVPEPAGLCLAIGGFAMLAARGRRV